MKKFFAFVAVALIAFSFSSCEKGQMGSSFFKLKVSNITSTTADISIEPADTTAYYFARIFESATVAKYTADTIAATYAANIDGYLKQGATGEALVHYGYLIQGKVAGTIPELPANTDLTLVAFQVVIDGTTAKHGDISYVNFKTPAMEVTSTVALDLVGEYTYYDEYGVLQIIAEDKAKGLELGLAFNADQPSGSFTLADCYEDGQYYWNYIYNTANEDIVEFTELSVNGTLANDIYTFNGYAITETGVKYTFANAKATEYVGSEEGGDAATAPKKGVAKKVTNELKLGSLKFMRFSK